MTNATTRFALYFYKVKGSAKNGFWVDERVPHGTVAIDGKITKDSLSAAVEIEDLLWKKDTEGVWWSSTRSGISTKGKPICELVKIGPAKAAAKAAASSFKGKIWKWMTRNERHIWG